MEPKEGINFETLSSLFDVNLFQLTERGYGNIDALDGSKGMLAKAKTKEIYKNHIHALVGSQPLREVKKGGLLDSITF